MQEIFLIVGILLTAYTLLFLVSVKLKDNSIADIFWGIGFIIIALSSYMLYWVGYLSQLIVTWLVLLWGMRLTLNILAKKLPYDGHEDPRYARWRKSWKYFYTRSFFQVYLFQWFLMCIVATPIFLINLESGYIENISLSYFWAWIALMWLIYESIADWELKSFVKTKESWEILTSWLRKFHRYPQYFWESVFWFGISLIALQISLWSLLWWLMITFLVRYVSWVPLLEERYKRNKKYQEYSKETPIFIPDFSPLLWKK